MASSLPEGAVESQGAFDVGGTTLPRPAGPLKQNDRQYAFWERQMHALVVWLVSNGYLSVDELRRGVEALPPQQYDRFGYYEKWAASVTAVLIERGTLSRSQVEEALGIAADERDPSKAAVVFAPGDTVAVRREDDVRRWRRPHLRVPGYLHGARGVVLQALGAFDNPSYVAFGEPSPTPQPLYRVRFEATDVWGAVGEGAIDADIFQPWLVAAPNGPLASPTEDGGGSAPWTTEAATRKVNHGDHTHNSRSETECKAADQDAPDPPLRPLASALFRLLAVCPSSQLRGKGDGAGPLTMAVLASIVEAMDDKMKAGLGRQIVARAWSDPEFKAWLLRDPPAACESLRISTTNYSTVGGSADISLYPPNADPDVDRQLRRFSAGHTVLRVSENTDAVHHVVVCTLCSCYPAAVLGLSPEWYKSAYYRSRVVREPRRVLRDDFGLELPRTTRIVVLDSTAEVRHLVLPQRPAGTDGWSEEQLQRIVSRDALLGVGVCAVDQEDPPYVPLLDPQQDTTGVCSA